MIHSNSRHWIKIKNEAWVVSAWSWLFVLSSFYCYSSHLLTIRLMRSISYETEYHHDSVVHFVIQLLEHDMLSKKEHCLQNLFGSSLNFRSIRIAIFNVYFQYFTTKFRLLTWTNGFFNCCRSINFELSNHV